ncbi:hypothetical protein Nepgr_028941 [Nepenthes gracilis]|uniref:Uncharacterized protein n=1 Tax=Nepenthes gracilis TaxID=150966 RepID=A0AAD3TD77_NEPGR|nr:hypothetical protein Nepgr_028941 [Nepenthes gracilis]
MLMDNYGVTGCGLDEDPPCAIGYQDVAAVVGVGLPVAEIDLIGGSDILSLAAGLGGHWVRYSDEAFELKLLLMVLAAIMLMPRRLPCHNSHFGVCGGSLMPGFVVVCKVEFLIVLWPVWVTLLVALSPGRLQFLDGMEFADVACNP